jgi:hypothetical protein
MEVVNSAGLCAHQKVFKGNQPRLVLLTRLLEDPADGFKIHHSPSLVITPSPSQSSSSHSESTESTESIPSSPGPPDLVSDSNKASEDSDNQEGRRTVAIAVAQVNIRREAVGGLSLTAMPNVRRKCDGNSLSSLICAVPPPSGDTGRAIPFSRHPLKDPQ